MKCPQCNKDLPEDSLFCQFCGKSIKSAPTTEEKSNNNGLKTAVYGLAIISIILAIALCCVGCNRDTQNIYFDKTGVTINVGDTIELDSFVLPENANNTNCNYETSDSTVVAINGHEVIGKDEGTAIITAVQNDVKYGQCVVYVKHIEPTEMILDAEDEEVLVGEIGRSFQIPIVFSPKTITDKNLSIEIENPDIAKVVNGTIVGLVEGKTNVKVRHRTSDLALSFNMEFIPVELESFKITVPTSIKIGDKIALDSSVSFLPDDVTDKSLKWSSSSSCAVIEDGVLIGKKEGTTTITAKHANGLKETIDVTVSEIPIDKISLSAFSNSVLEGAKLKLDYVLSPTDATNTKITWTSENKYIAKVDGNGLVTGVSAGNTIITAKTANGKTATFRIEVKPKPIEIRNGFVSRPSAYCCCPMTIEAPLYNSIYVVFKEDSDSSKDHSVLIKAGTTYSYDAPLGNFTLYYASGTSWYGKDLKFGESTSYQKGDTKIKNYDDGEYYYGHTLTLYGVVNGNMDSVNIPAVSFPNV